MDTDTATLEDKRAAQVRAAMQAEGQKTEEPVYQDYFGFSETFNVKLPDGLSFVTHSSLNEGGRRQYLNSQTKDVVVEKGTGNARMKLASGDDKLNLLKIALTGWNLQRGGKPVEFNKTNLAAFLENTNPVIVDLIHKDVIKHNEWLLDDMTVEQIDEEIVNLQELRVKVEKASEGKGN